MFFFSKNDCLPDNAAPEPSRPPIPASLRESQASPLSAQQDPTKPQIDNHISAIIHSFPLQSTPQHAVVDVTVASWSPEGSHAGKTKDQSASWSEGYHSMSDDSMEVAKLQTLCNGQRRKIEDLQNQLSLSQSEHVRQISALGRQVQEKEISLSQTLFDLNETATQLQQARVDLGSLTTLICRFTYIHLILILLLLILLLLFNIIFLNN